MPTSFLQSRRWRGHDVFHEPQDLPSDKCALLDNLVIHGGDMQIGGVAVTRPGKQGLFASKLPKGIYEPLPFIKSDGSTRVFFVMGDSGSTNGSLYFADKNTWVPTAVSGTPPTNISTDGIRLARVGGYGYGVDGVNPMFRFDATTGASVVSALNAPSTGPTASLTNTVLDPLTSATGWAGDLFATNYAYTDLVIGTPNTRISSAARPFGQADVGKTVNITGGAGFTVSTPAIASVAFGVATLSGAAGTIGSTGGIATMTQTATGVTLIPTSQSDIDAQPNTVGYSPGTPIGTSWVSVGTSPSINDQAHSGGSDGLPPGYTGIATKWFQLDDAGGGFQTPIGASALQNAVLASPNGDRNCSQFLVSFAFYSSDRRGLQGFRVTFDGFNVAAPSSLSQSIAHSSINFAPQFAGQEAGQIFAHVFDFPGLTDNIVSFAVTIVGGDGNVNSQQFGNGRGNVYAANIAVAPIDNGVSFTATPSGLTVTHAEALQANWGAVGGIRLTRDYGASPVTNWGSYNVLDIGLTTAPGSSQTVAELIKNGLSLMLGFRQTGSTTHYYSNPMDFAADGTYASVDVSTIPLSIRQSFRYFEVLILGDVAATASTSSFLTIGPITAAGNLSIGQADYGWVYEEVNALPGRLTVSAATNAAPVAVTTSTAHGLYSGDTVSIDGVLGNTAANGVWKIIVTSTTAFTLTGSTGNGAYTSGGYGYAFHNVIESDASPVSNALTPTTFKAEANVVIPASLNGATTHLFVYRYGGVFVDPYPTARLIAKVSVAQDANSGADGFWTWNHTTRTLLDNVPDSQLFGVETLIAGKGSPPVGAQALTQWQNRLWLAKGSTLYGSWLLNESASAALYFNAVSDPADPNLGVKGGVWSVGGADNDTIMALVPLGAMLIILKQRSVWMLTGTDGSNFELSGHLVKAGVGCVAPRAWALVQNHLWFLSGDGVWEYDGGELIRYVSQDIEPFLNPAQVNQPAIPAAAYKNAAMLYAGKRLYLFAPKDSAATANNCAHVFDARVQGWVRWLQMNATSACTTSTALDTSEVYLAGGDGQLYQLTGSGDKDLSGSTPTAVTFSFRSSYWGQEDTGPGYWMTNEPQSLRAAVTTGESAALTFTAFATGAAFSHPITYTVNGLKSLYVPSLPSGLRGDSVCVGIDGATVTQTKITSVAMESSEGQP
jgi:hypothetical protein